MIKYSRKLWPHWGRSPVEGFADVRQYMISLAMIGDYGIEDGRIVSGIWYCFYTGKIFDIEVDMPDLDHVVPLKGAHDRGGYGWTQDERKAFANDPANLIVCALGSNRQKSSMVSKWMIPNVANGAEYLQRINSVFKKYPKLVPSQNDISTYQFLVGKVSAWEKGIKLDPVKQWFKSTFGWKGAA